MRGSSTSRRCAWRASSSTPDARVGGDGPDGYERGFPVVWANRIFAALFLDVDTDALRDELGTRRGVTREVGERVPGRLVETGLPVPYEDAPRLREFHLQLPHAELGREHIVREFARAAREQARAGWVGAFVVAWNAIVENVTDEIGEGRRTVDKADYRRFVGPHGGRADLRSLPARMRGVTLTEVSDRLQREIVDLDSIAWVTGLGATLGSLVGFGVLWADGVSLFDRKLGEADRLVAAATENERRFMAFKWVIDAGYLGDAGLEFGRHVLASAGLILVMVIGFLVLQLIPGVDLLLDAAVLLYSGVDAVLALAVMVDQ